MNLQPTDIYVIVIGALIVFMVFELFMSLFNRR